MLTIFKNFVQLFFPQLCRMCKAILVRHESLFCSNCLFYLPPTNYHLISDDPVSRKFYGIVPIRNAMAMYRFKKGGKIQHMLHHLKYDNMTQIGEVLGKRYGMMLREANLQFDLVIPVPLHKDRLKERGYNQSQSFADGLADALSIKCNSTCIIRQKKTETQVQKTKQARWDNLQGAFQVISPDVIHGKKILLVDDVITTGATLSTCAISLLSEGAEEVSVATIAVAE